MGGGFALLLAGSGGYGAASVNYGMLPSDLDDALDGACPVVGTFGGRDLSLRGAAAKLEAALVARDIEHDVVEYPEPRPLTLGGASTSSSGARSPEARYLLAAFETESELCMRPLAAFLSALATRFSFSVFDATVLVVFLRADFSPMTALFR
jgi:carboxymethylenebutenolidase